MSYWSSFLRAAFVDGINTNNDQGLKKVVTRAGLDWSLAKKHLGQPDWETLVENNRLAMYNAGLWGFPAFACSMKMAIKYSLCGARSTVAVCV